MKIQNYHTQVFAKFIDRLSTTAGRRRLAAGSLHHPVRQQHVQQRPAQQRSAAQSRCSVAATASIKGGQHLHYPQDTPHANLLLTLLDRAGVPRPASLGNSTGQFAEI